jgi:hypothetical protein
LQRLLQLVKIVIENIEIHLSSKPVAKFIVPEWGDNGVNFIPPVRDYEFGYTEVPE